MSRIKLYNNLTQYQNAISTLPGLHVAFDGNNVYYSYAVTQAIKTSPRTSLNLHVQEHSTYISRYPSLAQPWVVFDGEHVHYSSVVEIIHYTLTLNFSGAHITINGVTYQNQYIGTYVKDQTITIPDAIATEDWHSMFSGWYFDSNLTQEAVNINSYHQHQMTDNLTLYAEITYFYDFDFYDPSGHISPNSQTSQRIFLGYNGQVIYGSSINRPSTISYPGYRFAGWEYEPLVNGQLQIEKYLEDSDQFTSSMRFYADWVKTTSNIVQLEINFNLYSFREEIISYASNTDGFEQIDLDQIYNQFQNGSLENCSYIVVGYKMYDTLNNPHTTVYIKYKYPNQSDSSRTWSYLLPNNFNLSYVEIVYVKLYTLVDSGEAFEWVINSAHARMIPSSNKRILNINCVINLLVEYHNNNYNSYSTYNFMNFTMSNSNSGIVGCNLSSTNTAPNATNISGNSNNFQNPYDLSLSQTYVVSE